jgi:hypothetical protein
MKTRSCNSRFSLETLEGRRMMSTVGYGDFNGDGFVDTATLTNPTTVTVSLAKTDGSGYTVAAVFSIPKNRPASDIYVGDFNGDGKQDINAVGGTNSGAFVTHQWLGNGDGTFASMTTSTFRWPKHGGFF